MAEYGRHKLAVPETLDPDNVPVDMARLVDSLSPHIVGHAENLAERNTRHGAAPAMSLVMIGQALYLKTGAGPDEWRLLIEPPTPWYQVTIEPSNTSHYTQPLEVRAHNDRIEFRGGLEGFGSGGTGTLLGQIPAEVGTPNAYSWMMVPGSDDNGSVVAVSSTGAIVTRFGSTPAPRYLMFHGLSLPRT